MPKAKNVIDDVIESTESYQLRRIPYTLEKLKSQEKPLTIGSYQAAERLYRGCSNKVRKAILDAINASS